MIGRRGLASERGAALIGVLWIVMLLALLSLGVLHLTLRNRQAVNSLEVNAQASQLALSAVELFVKQRFQQSSSSYVESAEVAIGDSTMSVSAAFEAGKIDLNKADSDHISAVFAFLGADEDTAVRIGASVADWRDSDNDRRPAGAEGDSYISNGLSYVPRNGPFETVGELSFVLGAAEIGAFCARNYFTVYSDPGVADIIYPLASQSVVDTLNWARQNDWQGRAWPTSDLFEEDVLGLDIENKAVAIATSFDLEGRAQHFRTVVRIKSGQDMSFVVLDHHRVSSVSFC